MAVLQSIHQHYKRKVLLDPREREKDKCLDQQNFGAASYLLAARTSSFSRMDEWPGDPNSLRPLTLGHLGTMEGLERAHTPSTYGKCSELSMLESSRYLPIVSNR